jgi:hypothetical protein
MWAEAWIGPDEWVPMDAALDGFDVGHIAITKSALEEVNPLVDLNMPILQMMESLKIEVVKTVPKSEMEIAPAPLAHATPPAFVPMAPPPVSAPGPAPEPQPSSERNSNLPPLD